MNIQDQTREQLLAELAQLQATVAELRAEHAPCPLDRRTACRLAGARGDSTEKKSAQEALRKSEAKYRALIESCPDAVVVVDLQGQVVFASEHAAQQHRVPHPDALLGRSAADLIVAADRERFHKNITSLIQDGVHRNLEYILLRSDASTFEAEVSSAVIRGDSGRPEALMAVYRDVTERKQAERRLWAKEAEAMAAARIQAHLLPQGAPELPGFDIAGRCYPAEAAGGDHFDFLPLPDGSLLVALGDVSGHGLGPAILAADFCVRLRTLSASLCDLPKMAMEMNSGLYRETSDEVFVTAILGGLDPRTRSLTYVNAGHPPAIVFNASGRVKARLARGSLPFAIAPETAFAADDSVELTDGDLLFFYTDGLVDACRDGEPLFGVDRAIQTVRANQQRPAAEIVTALHHAAQQHAGTTKLPDDVTVVVIKVLALETAGC